MKRWVSLFCTLWLALLVAPTTLAQSSDWYELQTTNFAILYADGDQAAAQQYAGFIDTIFDETSAIFGHRVATPITLRLYPTLERYYEINPLARNLTGIVAHADYRRNEVVVILPQTRSQTEDEIQNNVRHELTHIIASDLSNDRLNVLFQEGLAQYVEHPSRELEAKIRLLQRASGEGLLLGWSELDDRDTFYRNSQVSYPESLSIVAFLVERYSFATLRTFVEGSARSSGFRAGLERSFGVPPDTLERDWLAWLPQYLAGGYQRNALTAYDLSPIQALLATGRYAEAEHELERALEWLKNTEQRDVLAQAEQLLVRSQAGQQAELEASEARAALERADFQRASELVEQARRSYANLGDTRQTAVLDEYAARAERGLRADRLLSQAGPLIDGWHYPAARGLIDQATADYTALGATERVNESNALRAELDRNQSLLGLGLLGLGLLGSIASMWRRMAVNEAEAW